MNQVQERPWERIRRVRDYWLPVERVHRSLVSDAFRAGYEAASHEVPDEGDMADEFEAYCEEAYSE